MLRARIACLALCCAVTAPAPIPTPGSPGYVMPWNRAATDSVVDLDPGANSDRFEFRGRLIALDGKAPAAGLLVYAYHADSHGLYFVPKYPDVNHKAGVLRSGPGGGFILRSTMPGSYEGGPHIHMDTSVPGKGRSAYSVNFYADSASWPLPGTHDQPSREASSLEWRAVLHLDPDRVYRTHKTLHLSNWYVAPQLDSLRAEIAHRYERPR
jgi:hypothetical protein